MKIKRLELKDILLIEPKSYSDVRGSFMENFRLDLINQYTKIDNFVQDNLVRSKKNVIRGLHYQSEKPQGKLIQVIKGEIFDVAIDIRKTSKTYGQWVGEILSDYNKKQLYIPEGFAHAYYSFSELNIIYYKLSNYYHPKFEDGIIWNDKFLKIKWPTKKPIVSKKDKKLKTFLDFKKNYKSL